MVEVKRMLRYVWQTNNEVIFPVSGTGTSAMDCALSNLIEKGDRVLVAVKGYFGLRLSEMSERYGGETHIIHKTWGETFTLEDITKAFEDVKPTIFCIVHAETSTGVLQPLDGIKELCEKHNTIWVLDTVTSLGCVPVLLDKWGVDVAYSGSQKGLSCPPGASPITFNTRAIEKVNQRKTKPPCFYLDATLLSKYWGPEKIYHHTASSSAIYGLHEGLRLVVEEGLENQWKRHRENSERFWSELGSLGLKCHVDESIRLPPLTTVTIPANVDGVQIIQRLRNEFNIEISGGLGTLAGKIWRIGIMGYNSKKENVDQLIECLKKVLPSN